MKKNVAGQKIGAQMVSASDGSAFTGAVTVYVTGDAGTQAAGSVGSGACTHEGNGYHTYAPAQAETDYDLIAFTFVGTGAVPATVQVYTTFPQSGDGYAKAVDVETDTQDIQSRLPAALVGGRIDANVGAISSDATAADNAEAFFDGTGYAGTNNVIPTVTTLTNLPAITAGWLTPTGIADDAITAAKLAADVTTELQNGLATAASIAALNNLSAAQVNAEVDAALSDVGLTTTVTGRIDAAISTRLASASYTAPLDAAGTRTAIGLATANLDTQLGDLPTNAELTTALGTADDATLAAIAALSIPTASQNATAVLTTQMTESYAADGVAPTPAQALFLIQQMLTEFSITGTALTVKKLDGSTTAATMTLDDDTSPTAVTRSG